MKKQHFIYLLAKNQRGFTLLAVLVAVTLIGLSVGMAGSTWSSLVQRSREKELFWRGDQYRNAIRQYYEKGHGGVRLYPRELKDLLRDPRSLEVMRHIRQLYNDPLTGKDWELIRDPGGRIQGVRSTSDQEPFRQDGFPEEYATFAGAKSYRDWKFEYKPVVAPNAVRQGQK
ncbi:MAG: type II secretion system GspH family protein [Desulfuromonadaceae bacterium]|nr:type II secretion system GspH family protein [Desulfuromonadaceae bacterium]